ncbi:hypothetical protein EYC80_000468 [Monilinia laxa]|uniref:Uncharacterized protein n=1 Tax=Monilinia laxa TaxID=61186 RepID=A0A5N6KAX4_MONLA|nr:hypothetical protein EYC80_000468 [Monilinia laxa]
MGQWKNERKRSRARRKRKMKTHNVNAQAMEGTGGAGVSLCGELSDELIRFLNTIVLRHKIIVLLIHAPPVAPASLPLPPSSKRVGK